MSLEYQLLKGDEPNYARLFHEATDGCWHEVELFSNKDSNENYRCKKCGNLFYLFHHIGNVNPTYDNPRDIFKRMKEKCGEEQYSLFMAQLEYVDNGYIEPQDWSGSIDVEYVKNPTALLRKAVKFLEGK